MISIQVGDPFIYDEYEPGDQVYLISWFDETVPGIEKHQIQKAVPVTNRGVERPRGWLGSTNGINKTSEGIYEIEALEIVFELSKEPIAGKRRAQAVATKLKLSSANDNG